MMFSYAEIPFPLVTIAFYCQSRLSEIASISGNKNAFIFVYL